MERDLPESFVTSGLALAKNAYIFGKPLMECTREEAIAAAAHGWASEAAEREELRRRTSFLISLL